MVTTLPRNGTMAPAEMEARAEEVASLLKTLAHPARLMLACTLAEGEFSVGQLEDKLGIRQPTLSQQLGVLRNEGLVETRRDGKWMYYRVARPEVLAILATLHQIFCEAQPAAQTEGEAA